MTRRQAIILGGLLSGVVFGLAGAAAGYWALGLPPRWLGALAGGFWLVRAMYIGVRRALEEDEERECP